MRDDQVTAGQQGDDHGDAENELERGPQHAHQLDETQRAHHRGYEKKVPDPVRMNDKYASKRSH